MAAKGMNESSPRSRARQAVTSDGMGLMKVRMDSTLASTLTIC